MIRRAWISLAVALLMTFQAPPAAAGDDADWCAATNLIVKRLVAGEGLVAVGQLRAEGGCVVWGQGAIRDVTAAYSTPITRRNRFAPVAYSAKIMKRGGRYVVCAVTWAGDPPKRYRNCP